jgi:hypothetical protein
VTEEVGANCVVAAATPPPTYAPGKEPAARPRFQEGSRDEVRVKGPVVRCVCPIVLCLLNRRLVAMCLLLSSWLSLSSQTAPGSPPSWPAFRSTQSPLHPPSSTPNQPPQVSILAPELGPLAAVMVAPEGGSWVLEEVNVSSSRTNHIDRFVCRGRLGGRKGEAAAYLTPVPPGAVVYGSGETARILTKVRAAGWSRLVVLDWLP